MSIMCSNLFSLGHVFSAGKYAVQSICKQPCRTTFILKRRWPPGLHKTGRRPKPLRGRHFVYDLVEDTGTKKCKPIEVILSTYVSGLGERGDRISMNPVQAYHNLLLPGLAVYASPENIEKYSQGKDDKILKEHSSPTAEKVANILATRVLAVVMNKENPWILEPWHIRTSFRKMGCHVPEDAIQLPEKPIHGPDLNLEMKEFIVTVTINNLETVPVRCRIHHWSTDPAERLPYIQDHWKICAEPLFPVT